MGGTINCRGPSGIPSMSNLIALCGFHMRMYLEIDSIKTFFSQRSFETMDFLVPFLLLNYTIGDRFLFHYTRILLLILQKVTQKISININIFLIAQSIDGESNIYLKHIIFKGNFNYLKKKIIKNIQTKKSK